MSKRVADVKYPPIKRVPLEHTSDVSASIRLIKALATEEQMQVFTPQLKFNYEWEENVLAVLAEEYSVFDAYINGMSHKMSNEHWYSTVLSMRGTCPIHGYAHGSNHWVLINTRNYGTTLVICHHDNLRRIIPQALPFPSSEMRK